MKEEQIKKIINTLINNKTLIEKIDKSFELVFQDNKITKEDIPLLINIIILITNNYNNVKINKNNLKNFIKTFIIELLKNYNERNENKLDINISDIEILIEPYIELLLLNINISGICKKSLCCCCFKSNNIDEEINEKLQNTKILHDNIKNLNKEMETETLL